MTKPEAETNKSDLKKTVADKSSAKQSSEVDQQLKDTFPASDAPSSFAGKDIAPQDREEAQKKKS